MTIIFQPGLLFVLAGPTGAGKNTLMNAVLEANPDLSQLPTATTRNIRPNEQQGREHLFVSHAEFERMIAQHELLEWQKVHTNLYGVPKRTIEDSLDQSVDRIMDVDVLGALTLFRLYPRNIILIFIQPGGAGSVEDIIAERLRNRGESDEEIQTRLERVKMELTYRPFFHYLILNDELEKATQTLNSIIWAERAKRELRLSKMVEHHPVHPITQTVCVLLAQAEQYVIENTSSALSADILDNEYPCETAYRRVKQFITVHGLQGKIPLPEAWLQSYIEPLYISYQGHSHHEEQIHWFRLEFPRDLDLATFPTLALENIGALSIPDELKQRLI
ncbi:MAG: guanylate kinase [Phototrophicaceae bacterium]